jgi:hypothetical protein
MKSHKLKILVLGSNPKDLDPLGTTSEFMAIDAQLRAGGCPERFELSSAWEVRAEMLPGLLARFDPHVLHFGGHGSVGGELLFQRDDGCSSAPNPDAIAAVFRVVPAGTRCVVLNACHSSEQAELIARHVDVAIGMRHEIEDHSAIGFAAGFYESLGFLKSVATAFDWAKVRMELAGLPDSDVPEMFVRSGVDPSKVFMLGENTDESNRVSEQELPTDEQLHRLLLSMFSLSELRRFLAFAVDKSLLAELSFTGGISDIAFEVVAALRSRGFVNASLREALMRIRPGRAADIAKLFGDEER